MTCIKINCNEIIDWDSFHFYFKKLFGFPDFYGENMDAWIDCMTYIDELDKMSKVKIEKGSKLTLQLENVSPFKINHPEIYNSLIECSAFLNFRRIDMGEEPVLILSFYN